MRARLRSILAQRRHSHAWWTRNVEDDDCAPPLCLCPTDDLLPLLCRSTLSLACPERSHATCVLIQHDPMLGFDNVCIQTDPKKLQSLQHTRSGELHQKRSAPKLRGAPRAEG